MKHTLLFLFLLFTLSASAQFAPKTPAAPNKPFNLAIPAKPWVKVLGYGSSYVLAFTGGVCHGKGEWELASNNNWGPRNRTSHIWRDAGNWITGTGCLTMGASLSLDGRIHWREVLLHGALMGLANWAGTRVGYYRMR